MQLKSQCGNFKIFYHIPRFHEFSILKDLEILYCLFCKNSQHSNFIASKCVQMADFALLQSPKIDFT